MRTALRARLEDQSLEHWEALGVYNATIDEESETPLHISEAYVVNYQVSLPSQAAVRPCSVQFYTKIMV